MYRRILVPTDGSDAAESAMNRAIDLADRYGAELLVLHVIDTRRYDTSIQSARDPLEREGRAYVDALLEAAAEADVAAEGDVVEGRPARAILDYADATDVDIVVMGRRGRGGLGRLLGSVTDYVVRHADVPVHLVPTAGGES